MAPWLIGLGQIVDVSSDGDDIVGELIQFVEWPSLLQNLPTFFGVDR